MIATLIESIAGMKLTNEEKQLLDQYAKPFQYKKGTIPIQQGDSLDSLYIIEHGLVRGFYLDQEGREVTKCFSRERQFFSGEGMISSLIATFSIECLEDVTGIRIPYQIIQELQKYDPQIIVVINNIIRKEYMKLEERTKHMLLEDATIRYEHFLEDYPDVIPRLKQKYIASYLGINPVTLSRIRHQTGI